jgi:hypothetical protein
MSKDNHEYHQSPESLPIDIIAEEHLREPPYYAEHSEVRRKNTISVIGNTIRTVFKQSLIISSPGLSSLSPDLGEMETYRRFLEGDNKETTIF